MRIASLMRAGIDAPSSDVRSVFTERACADQRAARGPLPQWQIAASLVNKCNCRAKMMFCTLRPGPTLQRGVSVCHSAIGTGNGRLLAGQPFARMTVRITRPRAEARAEARPWHTLGDLAAARGCSASCGRRGRRIGAGKKELAARLRRWPGRMLPKHLAAALAVPANGTCAYRRENPGPRSATMNPMARTITRNAAEGVVAVE